jgi:hypothetical protein
MYVCCSKYQKYVTEKCLLAEPQILNHSRQTYAYVVGAVNSKAVNDNLICSWYLLLL